MAEPTSLDGLWADTPAGQQTFDGGAGLSEPVRRYLAHAIGPGVRLANAVRLRMHGEIKLGRWRPFEAEQVISRTRGMIWTARTRLFGLPVGGFDRFLDGRGEMRWKVLGMVPLMSASGPDIARSASGRLAAESMWLPSMLSDQRVAWDTPADHRVVAHVPCFGYDVAVTLTIGLDGDIEQSVVQRWGNPGGGAFVEGAFGGIVEEERTFDGYTIPSRVRVGWHFGTERFDRDGEFFHGVIDQAAFK